MLRKVQSAGCKPLLQLKRSYVLRSFASFSPVEDNSHSTLVKQPTIVKKKNIKPYINIEIKEEDLEEIFSRSSGPGGQSVNKTNSRVQLTHKPTNITVTCQEQRDLFANRRIARKKLKDELDLLYNGDQSKVAKKIKKVKRRKSKAKRRAKEKYGSIDEDESDGDESSSIGDDSEEEASTDDLGQELVNDKSVNSHALPSNKSRGSK